MNIAIGRYFLYIRCLPTVIMNIADVIQGISQNEGLVDTTISSG